MTNEIIRVYHKAKAAVVFTEITPYIVGANTLRMFRGKARVPGGALVIDDKIPLIIEAYDEIKIAIDDGVTVTDIFGGLFIPNSDSNDEHDWRYESFNRLFKKRRISGVYLQKTIKQMMQLVIDEYFPELDYTDVSIPDDDGTLYDERFSSKLASEIFDKWCTILSRYWDVDKDKVVNVKTVDFTNTNYNITDTEILGKWQLNYDITNWNTHVRVEGASTDIVVQNDFTGTAVLAAGKKITIQQSAHTVELKRIPSGQLESGVSPLRGVIEGSDQDSTTYDYTYNPVSRVITISSTATVLATDTWRVKQTNTSQITSEQINPIAYEKFGQVQGAPFVNNMIKDQTTADNVAQALVDKYGFPLEIYTFDTPWSLSILPGNAITLNTATWNINKLVNVLELSISWDEKGATFNTLLNNINLESIDAFEALQIRIRQLEEKANLDSTFVKKIIFWKANIALEIYRVVVEKYDLGNSFRFDDTSGTANFDNPNRYMDGVNGSGSLTFVATKEAYNIDRKIKLFFNDTREWNSAQSTAVLDTTNCRVTF